MTYILANRYIYYLRVIIYTKVLTLYKPTYYSMKSRHLPNWGNCIYESAPYYNVMTYHYYILTVTLLITTNIMGVIILINYLRAISTMEDG